MTAGMAMHNLDEEHHDDLSLLDLGMYELEIRCKISLSGD